MLHGLALVLVLELVDGAEAHAFRRFAHRIIIFFIELRYELDDVNKEEAA